MLHIKPISEQEASPSIQAIYADIKQTFGISFVPFLFQLIANYEHYLTYTWSRIKQNMQTNQFNVKTSDIETFSDVAIEHIYKRSDMMSGFIQKLQPTEKSDMQTTVTVLSTANAKLILLSFGLREALKGVLVGVKLIENLREELQQNPTFTNILEELHTPKNDKEQSMSNVFSALTGNNSIIVSRYPEFFTKVALEMDYLSATQEYLAVRVGLEQFGQQAIPQAFTTSLGSSSTELIKLAGGKPFFDELLYLLYDTFPTTFPRLLFTSSLMKKALENPQ